MRRTQSVARSQPASPAENNKTNTHKAVLNVITDFELQCAPTKITMDFEIGIINACEKVYPGVPWVLLFLISARSSIGAYSRLAPNTRTMMLRIERWKIYAHAAVAYIHPSGWRPYSSSPPPARMSTRPMRCLRWVQCVLHSRHRDVDEVCYRGFPLRFGTNTTLPSNRDTARTTAEGWHNWFRIAHSSRKYRQSKRYTEICVTELALGQRFNTVSK